MVPLRNHTKGGDAEGGPSLDSLKREDCPETSVDHVKELVVKEFDMVLGPRANDPTGRADRVLV